MKSKPKREPSTATIPAIHEPIGAEWREWGPYLSERQWGTVREDYSDSGTAWDFFPHDHARSRAYRWGEDGLLGISDSGQKLCFALALWNGVDPILKERLFGLTGSQGNHGEDVKEYYYYLDATPTHSYLKGLYRYPQNRFPYEDLVSTNRSRTRLDPEYELIDTGIFAGNRFFDVVVEYAKFSPLDIAIRIAVTNAGPDPAVLHLLPTLWHRNTWSWGDNLPRPSIAISSAASGHAEVIATDATGRNARLTFEGNPPLLFTENESNAERLWGGRNNTPFVKDGIDATIVAGRDDAVNPGNTGTKVAAHYRLDVAPGQTEFIRMRLSPDPASLEGIDDLIEARRSEADSFYASLAPDSLSDDERNVQRQALAGLIWTKQYYDFDVERWLKGDPNGPLPPTGRLHGRNSRWRHHRSHDVISMPDKWEYPWYAAWDLAFHCVAFGLVDMEFAKDQLLLLTTERYMHPNGQLPAYEWAFGDVNPPVHIAATRALYLEERRRTGQGDREFLERIFHKLMLNFNWWVNRKDPDDRNLFEGGFLGLDNISVIDRSAPLPSGLRLEQSDGTAWMATYCLGMAWAAIELAHGNPTYEDLAITFFEHYMTIADAINGFSDPETALWNEEDGFYYDTVRRSDGESFPLRLRSLVGLLPIVPSIPAAVSEFSAPGGSMLRLREYIENFQREHPHLADLMPEKTRLDGSHSRLFTLLPEARLRRILTRMFDPAEFLGDFGIRSISRSYLEHPFEVNLRDLHLHVQYEPAESSTGMFGGNSNWRGPVWMPVNFLLVQGLRNLHRHYENDFTMDYPTGSGATKNLGQIADDIAHRLVAPMLRQEDGRRPVFGGSEIMQRDPRWRDHLLFYEYFHGDNGAGIGASHQTGWTALIANLLGSREA